MAAHTARKPVSSGVSWQAVMPSKPIPDLAEDVRTGLFQRPRSLPPKYFYDATGSQLFDQICDNREYYLTRAEDKLLDKYAASVIQVARPDRIVELGSGTSRKTRHLIEACDQNACYASYAPFDVCFEVLIEAGEGLANEYGWLEVHALVGDYRAGLDHVPERRGKDLVAFLGSTIGNFDSAEAIDFLKELYEFMGPGDWLLLGSDRVKAPDVLHAAYNDSEGLTANFNLNALRVINDELGANFDLAAFRHYACYNPTRDRIEMYLIGSKPQDVYIQALDRTLRLKEGEPILTEISCKYTRSGLEALLCEAGFMVERHYEAEQGMFSLVLARPK